jgi:hypothetical protein
LSIGGSKAVIGGAGLANFSTSTRRRWRGRRAGDALAISRPTGRFLFRSGVAALAADLVTQNRSAWSFEDEARPFKEKW